VGEQPVVKKAAPTADVEAAMLEPDDSAHLGVPLKRTALSRWHFGCAVAEGYDEYRLLGIHDGRDGAEAHDGDGGPEAAGVALRLNGV
jgi:hypothetical protein